MEFVIEKLLGQYHISSTGGGVGSPYTFQKEWGIPAGVVRNIFDKHNAAYDQLFYFPTEDDANAALVMLTLLRCNYDRRT